MNLPKKIKVLLILFILVDLGLSFNQHYNTPIDGDLTSIVLPANRYKAVVNDPLGLSAITKNKSHGESNRFFSIATTCEYFRTLPFIAQKAMSPISSIYFSSALFKILIQLLIIIMLSAYIAGKINFSDDKFILSAALITVFFQVGGYGSTMGIIDSSITYAIFYAFPIALVLIVLYPPALQILHHKKTTLNFSATAFLLLLAVIIAFSGNQIPFLMFAAFILTVINRYINGRSNERVFSSIASNKRVLFYLTIFLLFCLYSFFLGFYNSERNIANLSLFERYRKIPLGILNIYFGKPGLWILTLLIIINTIFLKRSGSAKSKLFNNSLKWSGLFIVTFVLLLPADGYYDFRPNIIRRDNFLPCILIMIFLFTQSAIYLVEHFSNDKKTLKVISVYLFAVILVFTIADSPSLRIDNCQRASLEMLASSEEKIVSLSDQCTIASWYVISDYKDSEVNSKVFYFWKITKEPKQYFQN